MTAESSISAYIKKPPTSSLAKLRQKLPQLTRMGRHALSVIKHSTPRKLFNLALVEVEYRLRRTKVRGHPYIIIVDPLNVCNLRCPLCPTGTGDLERKQQRMEWETFTRTIDEVAPYAYEINLHNWGESLLHPRIFDMIEYVNKKNIATNMSTNFNRASDEKIDKLITSGLEYLILSIDGITQDTYVKYRVRGSVSKVLSNVEKLIQRRKELGSKTPFIEWQFIVFEHNAHELEAARQMAHDMGVDRFRVIPPGIPFASKEPDKLKDDWFIKDDDGRVEAFQGDVPTSCFYLYRSMTTNPDGGTAPCCIVYGDKNDFGDFKTESLDQIWNNKKYQSARALFKKGGRGVEPTICDGCHIFKQHGLPAAPRKEIPLKVVS
jgi:radical SAM protein with 4Fe4S-binding SPASM domain